MLVAYISGVVLIVGSAVFMGNYATGNVLWTDRAAKATIPAMLVFLVAYWLALREPRPKPPTLEECPVGISAEDAARRARIFKRIALPVVASSFGWVLNDYWLFTVIQLIIGGLLFSGYALLSGWKNGILDYRGTLARAPKPEPEPAPELEQDEYAEEIDFRWFAEAKPATGKLGHVYIIRFSTGMVKVGKTNDLVRRMGEHRRSSARYGVVMTGVWFSLPHPDWHAIERRLIAEADRRSTYRVKQEYFKGIENFDELADWLEDTTPGLEWDYAPSGNWDHAPCG